MQDDSYREINTYILLASVISSLIVAVAITFLFESLDFGLIAGAAVAALCGLSFLILLVLERIISLKKH